MSDYPYETKGDALDALGSGFSPQRPRRRPLKQAFEWYVDLIQGLVPEGGGGQPADDSRGGPELNQAINESHEAYLEGRSGVGEPAGDGRMPAQTTQGFQRVPEPEPEELGLPEVPSSGYRLRANENLVDPSEMERRIQEGLVRLGAEIDMDGYAGPQTVTAINEIFGTDLKPPDPETGYPGDEIPPSILEELLK